MQANWVVKPKYDPQLPYTDWRDAQMLLLLQERFRFMAWTRAMSRITK